MVPFNEDLEFSKGKREKTDKLTIKKILGEDTQVRVGTKKEDLAGADFISTMRDGREIRIDVKTRRANCSKYWKWGPDFTLETWSIMETKGKEPKIGWTLDETKSSDYILFTFDIKDWAYCYLVPAALLRELFKENREKWWKIYKHCIQNNSNYDSESIYIPASLIEEEIPGVIKVKYVTG